MTDGGGGVSRLGEARGKVVFRCRLLLRFFTPLYTAAVVTITTSIAVSFHSFVLHCDALSIQSPDDFSFVLLLIGKSQWPARRNTPR